MGRTKSQSDCKVKSTSGLLTDSAKRCIVKEITAINKSLLTQKIQAWIQ